MGKLKLSDISGFKVVSAEKLRGVIQQLLVSLNFMFLLVYQVYAEDSKGSLSVSMENDLFGAGTDKHYTHGTEISYASDTYMPSWFEKAIRLLPFAGVEDEDRFSWAIGQKMYTPDDISQEELIVEDRPYAGWLYASFGLITDDRTDRYQHVDSLELLVGVIGPNSGAENVQKKVHEWVNSEEPQGWDNQLKNEYTFDIRYRRAWLIPVVGNNIDILPSFDFTLGTSQRFVNTGFAMRIGTGLSSDYGPPLIRPAASGSYFFKPQQPFYGYFFIGAYGRYVDYNVFLDGNRDGNSHSIERRDWIGDVQAGLVMGYKNWRVTVTNIYRTREFEGQLEPDEFGSLALSYRF